MRIAYRIESRTPRVQPELQIAPAITPVQVILYDDHEPTVITGTGQTFPGGLTVIELPPTEPPPPGTPIQIILYPPQGEPTVIQGTTTQPGEFGVIGVNLEATTGL